MFLHGGNQCNIRKKNIIGIFDMDTATVSPITKKYLNRLEGEDALINISEELPKSFVLTDDGNKQIVYISQLSPQTLTQRCEQPYKS